MKFKDQKSSKPAMTVMATSTKPSVPTNKPKTDKPSLSSQVSSQPFFRNVNKSCVGNCSRRHIQWEKFTADEKKAKIAWDKAMKARPKRTSAVHTAAYNTSCPHNGLISPKRVPARSPSQNGDKTPKKVFTKGGKGKPTGPQISTNDKKSP